MKIFQKSRQSLFFTLSPSFSPYCPSTHFQERKTDDRGTDSEIELRVSLKKPISIPLHGLAHDATRRFRARSRHSSRSLNYSTHSRAPCGNSSPPTSSQEHYPRLKEQWDTQELSRVADRENKRRSTNSMRCEASIVSKRWEIEGLYDDV